VLKFVLLGVWAIVVTAASTYGSVYLAARNQVEDSALQQDEGVEELKSEMTSVPMIRGGDVIGYVIIQLSFEADRRLLAKKKLEPSPYLNDAAFRVIFSNTDIDFRRLKPNDLDKLTADVASEANKRIGSELIRQVLIQQLNFVRREEIRTNWIAGGAQKQN
jgi:hypothetical protein